LRASIIIRTYNEARHLGELLAAIRDQDIPSSDYEVILVDSGSTDGTLELAASQGAKEVFISREEFSFGRSLNYGCQAARGKTLVFVSGHCIPEDGSWLRNLTDPILDETVTYTYGKQRGGGNTKYSENQLFRKYFPENSMLPQEGFFCNNANAALSRAAWMRNPFNESVTGLEDMELAKRLVSQGQAIGYVAEAGVKHLHDETWRQIRWRYEREAIALQAIMPNIHVTRRDFIRYFAAGVLLDWGLALQDKRLHKELVNIVRFRWNQYRGSYRGNHEHRKLSQRQKEHYFYPTRKGESS
jgi:rhamnosyltransferase